MKFVAWVDGVDMVGHTMRLEPDDASGKGIVFARGMRNHRQNNSRLAI